jgi:hypothetical protein
MEDRYPLTKDQVRQTDIDLGEMQQRSEEISQLFSAAYGAADQRAVRAEEVFGSVQRLRWVLHRLAKKTNAMGA